MYDNSTKNGKKGTAEILYAKHEVVEYYLKVASDELKIYILNVRAMAF